MKKYPVLLLVFIFTLYTFAEKKAVLTEPVRPNSITVDGERMFITDGPTVFIYSLKDFKLQKKFGREGEGPSEFKTKKMYELQVIPLPDSLFIGSMGKISYFSKTGKFIRETPCPLTARGATVLPLTKGFAGTGSLVENKKPFRTVNIYDKQFKKEKELFREENIMDTGTSINPLVAPPTIRVGGDRIFVNSGNGVIHGFDHKGNTLFSIKNIYEKKKVRDIHIKKIHEGFKTDPRTKPFYEMMKSRLKFPEFFPSIRDYKVADNKAYVLPYAFKDGKGFFHIYDCNGTLLKKSAVSIAEKNIIELFPYTIKDSKLYQLIENEENEEWEIHISTFRF